MSLGFNPKMEKVKIHAVGTPEHHVCRTCRAKFRAWLAWCPAKQATAVLIHFTCFCAFKRFPKTAKVESSILFGWFVLSHANVSFSRSELEGRSNLLRVSMMLSETCIQ